MKKIITAMICLIAFALAGCSDKALPPLGETEADLSEDYLDGQWDVWLEIWKAGDRTDVYKSKLRFNLTSSLVDRNGSYSIETKKTDERPERFSGLPGFQPEHVHGKYMGYISIEESNVIYILVDGFPEYTFHMKLTKNEDGFLTGYSQVSFEEEGGTAATLHIVQVTQWGTAIVSVCVSCHREMQAGWNRENCLYCGGTLVETR